MTDESAPGDSTKDAMNTKTAAPSVHPQPQ